MTRPFLKAILPLCLLTACAASPLMPGGETVLLSKDDAPEGCQFLGEVQGTQGNFWTADLTSDANLINGARNQVRNALSHNTADHSFGGMYSAVIIGNAYRCGKELVAAQQIS